MSNPLIEKYEQLKKQKEEPKVAFELTPEFKEAIDKEKEDRLRYLASLPKDLCSVATGSGGITAAGPYTTSISNNYINASNASVSYQPYRPKPVSTYDVDNCKQSYFQVAEMIKKGDAKVINMTMEQGCNNGYFPEKKVIFEVAMYD